MAGRGLFQERPVGAVALVETPVSRVYARRARLAFAVVALSVGVLATMAQTAVRHPAAALVVGALVGAVAGLTAALLVRVWPILRAQDRKSVV